MLETYFKEEDIEDIYNNTVLYSIIKYNNSKEDIQEFFKDRYKNALISLKKRNISREILKYTNELELEKILNNYKQIYNINYQLNKKVIQEYAPIIEEKIIERISNYPSPIERISILCSFLSKYLTYSEDYVNYCLRIPPIGNFDFDFKNNVPVDSSIEGLLVIGQGICDDISNLLVYLGKKLNLDIEKVFTKYKNNLHSLNKITIDNNTYLIDLTRLIKKDKEKEECFLVSKEKLNQKKEYEFEEEILTKTYNKELPQTEEISNQLLNIINQIKPQIYDLNTKKK